MSEWSAGYVSDIRYTYGCYGELVPLTVPLACLDAGLAGRLMGCRLRARLWPRHQHHHTRRRLGHAMAWHRLQPSQAPFAKELAVAAGAGAHLYDEAFADSARRSDLPDFDFAGLHGIWSWISDENR